VLVFARAPVAGAVKTRLVPALGAEGAARLHARMAKQAVRTALAAAGHVELHCAPRTGHLFFRQLSRRYGVGLRAQKGSDLGARMLHALRVALRRRRAVVLIGSDCPELRPQDLRAAFRALRSGASAVFSPAQDGGYALIGLRRISARLFEAIDWGGPEVMAQTHARLRELGWRWRELRSVWDVDRPEDLERLRASFRTASLRASQIAPAFFRSSATRSAIRR
jgi:rSAM/selenodomain-associated transferase 1